MNGSKVLLLGSAYKNDIDDMRESPALKVIEHLEKMELTYRLMIHIYLNLNIKVNYINHQI